MVAKRQKILLISCISVNVTLGRRTFVDFLNGSPKYNFKEMVKLSREQKLLKVLKLSEESPNTPTGQASPMNSPLKTMRGSYTLESPSASRRKGSLSNLLDSPRRSPKPSQMMGPPGTPTHGTLSRANQFRRCK